METKMDGRWRLFRVPEEFRLQVRRRLHGRKIAEDGIISEMTFRKAHVRRSRIAGWITKGMLLAVDPDEKEPIIEDTAADVEPEVKADPVQVVQEPAVQEEKPKPKRGRPRKNQQAAAPRTEG